MKRLRQIDWVFVTRRTLDGCASFWFAFMGIIAFMQATTQITVPGLEIVQALFRTVLSTTVFGPQDLAIVVFIVCWLYVVRKVEDIHLAFQPFDNLDRAHLRLIARASAVGIAASPIGTEEWCVFVGGYGPERVNSFREMEEFVERRENAPGHAPNLLTGTHNAD